MRSTLKLMVVLTLLVAAPLLISTISANAQELASVRADKIQASNVLDCTTASKPAEFAICNDEDLIIMHEELSEIYSSKISQLTTKPQIQHIANQHFSWVKTRNECKQNSMCLKFQYRERIRDLSLLSS